MRPGRAVNQPCAGHRRVSATPREAPEGRPPETQCPLTWGSVGMGSPGR